MARLLLSGGAFEMRRSTPRKPTLWPPDNPKMSCSQGRHRTSARQSGRRSRFRQSGTCGRSEEPRRADDPRCRADEEIRPKGCSRHSQQGEEDNPNNLGLQLFRIAALEATRDKAGIEEVFIKLTSQNPQDKRFRDGLARWYMSERRPAEAEKVLRDFEPPIRTTARRNSMSSIFSEPPRAPRLPGRNWKRRSQKVVTSFNSRWHSPSLIFPTAKLNPRLIS